MKIWFPYWENKNIRIYYLLGVFTNLWFIESNWIFFWTKFMSYGQLGILDAMAFTFGLVMEVPSGAISDLVGKRKTIIWSMGLSAIGSILIALSQNMTTLWIGFFIAQLGWALYSGAGEALAYDSLLESKESVGYDQVASTSNMLQSVATVTAILVGGILYVWWFRSTHIFWSIGYFIAFILSFKLVEPKIDSEKFSLANYRTQLISGIKQLFNPKLAHFMLVIFVLMGIGYLFSWGLIKPIMATEFGFMAEGQSVIFAAISVVGAIAVYQVPKLRKLFSDKPGLYLLTMIMGIGYVLSYFKLGYYGIFPMLLIGVTGQLAYPWVSTVVNDEIESKYRATTLSTVALLTKIPYTILAVIAGSMAEKGTFNQLSLSIGIVVIVSVIVGVVMSKLRQ